MNFGNPLCYHRAIVWPFSDQYLAARGDAALLGRSDVSLGAGEARSSHGSLGEVPQCHEICLGTCRQVTVLLSCVTAFPLGRGSPCCPQVRTPHAPCAYSTNQSKKPLGSLMAKMTYSYSLAESDPFPGAAWGTFSLAKEILLSKQQRSGTWGSSSEGTLEPYLLSPLRAGRSSGVLAMDL